MAGNKAPETPRLVLVRHGETEWTITGRHTGRSDVPLTVRGREQAERLRGSLAHRSFTLVLSSPRRRAVETCRLAGFGLPMAQPTEDLAEWDYGDYEGRTTAEIRQHTPGWTVWRDGAPGGETAAQIGARADRVIATLRKRDGDTLLFSHGHFLRVLAARWLDLPPAAGRFFALDPASISVLAWERQQPVVAGWNDAGASHPPSELLP